MPYMDRNARMLADIQNNMRLASAVRPPLDPPPRPGADVPQAGTVRLGEGGAHGYVGSGSLAGVRTAPWLIDTVRQASRALPQGYTAQIISTVDARDKTPYHPNGRAIDIQIYDPQGNKVPNTGRPETPGWSVYENMAAAAKAYQEEKYPNEVFRWGGHIDKGYPPYDRMHFQSGGDTARHFTPQQVATAKDVMKAISTDPDQQQTASYAATATQPPAQQAITAALTGNPSTNYPPAQNPGYRTPVTQPVEGGGTVPLPWRRPAAAGPDQTGTVPPQGPTEAQLAGRPGAPPAPAAAPAAPGAPAARPATAGTAAPGALGTGGGLGAMLGKLFGGGATGAAPPGASTYLDPATNHIIVNPSGSGETAMGLTRDLGAAPSGAPTATARPAPASRPPTSAATTAVVPPPAAGPVYRRSTVPDILAPPPQTTSPNDVVSSLFNADPMARQQHPLSGGSIIAPEEAGLLAAPSASAQPLQPPAAVASSRPPFVQPPNASTTLSDNDEMRFQSWLRSNKVNFDPRSAPGQPTDYDMRGFWQRQQQGDPLAQNRVDPNDNRMHYPDVWKTPSHETFGAESMYSTSPNAPQWVNDRQMATPDARLTFGQRSPMDAMLTPPPVFPGSAAVAPPLAPPGGGPNVPPIPVTQPTTVSQQLGGLSPFAQMPQPMAIPPTQADQDQWLSRFAVDPRQSAFASTTLLPFDYPTGGYDTAGWSSPANYNYGDFG